MNLTETQLLTFLSITLLLTVTPGVDTFLVVRNVIRGGRIDGVYTGLGVCSGLFVHATLSALGITVILLHSALLFGAVKMLGGLYLVWLGLVSLVGAWRRKDPDNPVSPAPSKAETIFSRSYLEGLLSNVLNPKPALFYLAFFPQFISAGDPVLLKSIFLAGIQFVIGVLWLSTLSITLSALGTVVRRPAIARLLSGVTGCVLVGLGIKLAMDRR
jgi:threonine/homoserine/homoserine lactone efflux protein